MALVASLIEQAERLTSQSTSGLLRVVVMRAGVA
jgi:hypothetical protein